jgi:hypothetical protein
VRFKGTSADIKSQFTAVGGPVDNPRVLILLFALIVYAFLFLGAVVFVVCALIPPTRRYALSAALWCAVWGPCSVGLMTLAGLGLVVTAFINDAGGDAMLTCSETGRCGWLGSSLLATIGWGYLILGALITVLVATAVAWLHQVVMRRLMFVLFRLYATAVCAGIGSVFGWALSWWLTWKQIGNYGIVLSCLGMLGFVLGFGAAAHKGARLLQGTAPAA